jgi:hypothetical protein
MPIQIHLSPYQIKRVWKSFCDRWIHKVAFIQNHPLGQWTSSATHFRSFCISYIDNTHGILKYYKWHHNNYWELDRTPTTNSEWDLLSLKHPSTWKEPVNTAMPIQLIPAGLYKTRPSYRCPAFTPKLPITRLLTAAAVPTTPLPNASHRAHHNRRVDHTCPAFHSYIRVLPPWVSLLLSHVCHGRASPQIVQTLKEFQHTPKHQLYAIVEHWFTNNIASFGWFLFSTTGEVIAKAHGPSPGPPSCS